MENKPATNNATAPNGDSHFELTFQTINYILMGAGLILLALGYILLAGGGSDSPDVFNPAMFDKRRLVVAPVLIVLGFVVEIVAIMYSPKAKNQ